MSAVRPFVTVVIACHNAEPYLQSCFDSLLSQTHQDFEIVIIDDCSTDQSWRIIQDYAHSDSRIRGMRNTTRMYAAETRNRCIAASRGQYIMLQDADDVSVSRRMETLLLEIERSEASFVSSGYDVFDDDKILASVSPKRRIPTRHDFLYGSPFCHASTLFRRDCLEDVGGYRVSSETVRGQDYDLFMRLYAHGHVGFNIQDVLYAYRVDARTLSRRTFRYRLDECRIRARGFAELGMMPWAAPFVLKPVVAHVATKLRRW